VCCEIGWYPATGPSFPNGAFEFRICYPSDASPDETLGLAFIMHGATGGNVDAWKSNSWLRLQHALAHARVISVTLQAPGGTDSTLEMLTDPTLVPLLAAWAFGLPEDHTLYPISPQFFDMGLLLIGHSQGASACLKAAETVPAKGVIALAPGHMSGTYGFLPGVKLLVLGGTHDTDASVGLHGYVRAFDSVVSTEARVMYILRGASTTAADFCREFGGEIRV
jgi:pimeloyl-ACP methyl ester carboxylesterase